MKRFWTALGAGLLALLSAWGVYTHGPDPAPSPTPVATVTPLPTPAPTAFPTPSPASNPCANFEATGAPWVDNPTTLSAFRQFVFEWQDQAAANGFVVGDWVVGEKEYTAEVARIGRERGFVVTSCGLPDEVWVMGSGFSESFDVVTSEGYVWNHFAALVTPAAWREKEEGP